MKSNTAKKTPKKDLSTPIQFLKGLGPARAASFSRKGIVCLRDALYYFPRKYEDRRRLSQPGDLAQLPEGLQVTVLGRIERQKEIPIRGRSLFEITMIGQDSGLLICTWFHVFKGMKEKYAVGKWAIVQGALKKYRGAPQIVHPEMEIFEKPPPLFVGTPTSLHWGRVVPIYSRSEKLTQKYIREVLHNCLEVGLPLVEEILPLSILEKYQLPKLRDALAEMHFPSEMPRTEVSDTNELPAAVRRLIFEEFFKLQLVLRIDRSLNSKKEPAQAVKIRGQLAQKVRKNIPYRLTNAQERSIAEVVSDLQKNLAMNRIVQGDVGSGKTFVAFLSSAEVLENEMQLALMAPTEILAEQHYQNAMKIFADTGIEPLLLTGSLPRDQKEKAQEKVRSGEARLVIGTHALIQESVSWKNLALVIVDEQHRFGVLQRAALKEKAPPGLFPHILTMTATPIPRSLALTVFGELEVSTIDEIPPGRQEIATKVVTGSDRQKLYNLIHKEVKGGRQAYIVYPLVTDSDKEGMEKVRSVENEFERLRAGPLGGLRIAFVHGQMKSQERNELMMAFKAYKYDVLIATTVIEVGVDVPNATVMAIENAERFGLSQLHQLRGRVGRGQEKSYCVLVTDAPQPGARKGAENSEEGVEDESPWVRLRVLENSCNGFEIAEQDLKLRGPGDFLGTKQSGSPSFRLADLSRDQVLLEAARKEAIALYERDPQLLLPENAALAKWLAATYEEAALALKSG